MHANTKQVVNQYKMLNSNDIVGIQDSFNQMASEIAEAREILRQIKNACEARLFDVRGNGDFDCLKVIHDNAATFLEVHEPQPSH